MELLQGPNEISLDIWIPDVFYSFGLVYCDSKTELARGFMKGARYIPVTTNLTTKICPTALTPFLTLSSMSSMLRNLKLAAPVKKLVTEITSIAVLNESQMR